MLASIVRELTVLSPLSALEIVAHPFEEISNIFSKCNKE